MPKYFNPSDQFMKILTINYPKQEEDEDKISKLRDVYYSYIEVNLDKESDQVHLKSVAAYLQDHKDSRAMAPFCTQMRMLYNRVKVQNIRNP